MDEGAYTQFLCSRSGGEVVSCFRPLPLSVYDGQRRSSFFPTAKMLSTLAPGFDRPQDAKVACFSL